MRKKLNEILRDLVSRDYEKVLFSMHDIGLSRMEL